MTVVRDSGAGRVVHSVLVVEDHDVMRESLVEAVGRMDGLVVCGAVTSGEEALGMAPHACPDVALVDMSLPGMSGADVAAALAVSQPTVAVLILSGHRERSYVERALGAGAVGYVVKGYPEEIEIAIRTVAAGVIYLSASLRF